MFEEYLTFIYVTVGVVGTAAFYPQIMRVIKDNTGAYSTSLLAWGFWTFEMLISLLYATIIIGDKYLILMNVLGALGCGIVFFIALYKRITYSKTQSNLQE